MDKSFYAQIDYLLPNPELRKKYNKSKRVLPYFLGGLTALITIGIIITNIIPMEDDTRVIAGLIIFFGNILLMLAVSSIFSAYFNILLKKQYREMEQFSEKYPLHFKLHEVRKPFYKRWNIIMLIGLFGAVISSFLITGIVSFVTGNDDYEWIFLPLICAEIIFMLIAFSKSLKRLRLAMIPIEDEIDKAENNGLSALY